MEPIFTIIMVLLAILAILDLIVGVSNDAINFLNSALGSKVASLRTILIVASCGILVGVLTSHGMMEVARNGVFHPEKFTFAEVMFLFVGMMLSDVILLNAFNKKGLPTSTTVSLIFELLGAAVAVSVFKVTHTSGLTIFDVSSFINSGKALVMISAILCSVVLSFITGSVVMYVSRLIFSFHYAKQLRKWGALWCGISIVGILYFALFKGLKSSGLLSGDFFALVNDNLGTALLVAWIAASAILWVLQRLKVDILKITILSGTFALALAFAGNDLVNFIGVPLAGLDSYKLALSAGNTSMLMGALAQPTATDSWLLIAAGVIMIVTLFFSRDAMRVSQTELNLSSQNDEEERFGSTGLSRMIVRQAIAFNQSVMRHIPNRLIDRINSRFIPLSDAERAASNSYYDKIRSVVNLASAAILICIGTSLKLPLSTTYVVFMVAMGSSLADRAWGRESAVYRITGVMVVIMGWFLTAVIGFTISFLITAAMLWGGNIAFALIVLLSAYALCSRIAGSRGKKKHNQQLVDEEDTPENVLYNCTRRVCDTMAQVSRIYNRMLVALFTENRHVLKEMVDESRSMYEVANQRKYSILPTLKKFKQQNIETGQYYVQIVDYLCEVTKALLHCTKPAYDHINNNHRGLSGQQIKDLKTIDDKVDEIFLRINAMLANNDFSKLDDVMTMRDNLFDLIADTTKRQIRRLQEEPTASKHACMLFLNLLSETKTMVLQSRNLIKAEAYFLNAIDAPSQPTGTTRF